MTRVSLIPGGLSDGLRSGVRNLIGLSPFGEDLETPQPTPQTVLVDEPHEQLRRFHLGAEDPGPLEAPPVLLVPPLAVPADCYDLRPGQSLALHLLDEGFAPYVVDYGDITFADRRMGFEDFVDGILLRSLRHVSDVHEGARVHVVAWSLGGSMSVMTLASHLEAPVASLTALGTPFDYSKIPTTQLARLGATVTGGSVLGWTGAALGGVPRQLTRAAFRLSAAQRELMKPWFIARNLTDTETLARMQSIDGFMDRMPGYPGRLYLQMYHRLVLRLELARGRVRLSDDRLIDLSALRAPVLLIGSPDDAIGPAAAVKAGVSALSGADVRFVEVRGSHLGIVAGSDAATQSWPHIVEFLRTQR